MCKESPLEARTLFLEAQHLAALWLHRGNKASERGDQDLAERHYNRSQKWHDRMNELLGNT